MGNIVRKGIGSNSRRRVMAGEDVTAETQTLLFEAEDVAEVIAEVTGEPVDVTTDEEEGEVTFEVDGEEFTVKPDGTEEVLESRRIPAGRSKVSASTSYGRRGRTVRKYPKSR